MFTIPTTTGQQLSTRARQTKTSFSSNHSTIFIHCSHQTVSYSTTLTRPEQLHCLLQKRALEPITMTNDDFDNTDMLKYQSKQLHNLYFSISRLVHNSCPLPHLSLLRLDQQHGHGTRRRGHHHHRRFRQGCQHTTTTLLLLLDHTHLLLKKLLSNT